MTFIAGAQVQPGMARSCLKTSSVSLDQSTAWALAQPKTTRTTGNRKPRRQQQANFINDSSRPADVLGCDGSSSAGAGLPRTVLGDRRPQSSSRRKQNADGDSGRVLQLPEQSQRRTRE